jgi:predicted phage terminase large subunit-like protein
MGNYRPKYKNITKDDEAALALISAEPDRLTAAETKALLNAVEQLQRATHVTECRQNFIAFARHVWPQFKCGPHHTIMAEAFERLDSGKSKRLILNVPPRFGKSYLTSWLLPAWLLGKHPELKIMAASHTAEFAQSWGRKVRDLIKSEKYKEIFPDTVLKHDSSAAGRWQSENGGEYFAVGVGGSATGRGADLLLLDDVHSEEAGIQPTPEYFKGVYEWYTSGPRQRLHPGGKICVIQTRWAPNDLTGMILENARQRNATKEWEVIELPAILENGQSLWPDFWPLKDLESLKAELPVQKWESQYMQRPSSEGAAIIKREWWNVWEQERFPECEYTIMSLDTAYSSKESADFSCFTVWGVFPIEDKATGRTINNIMLLDVVNERVDFPLLKKIAVDMYKTWKPDSFIIEAKASGKPLADELGTLGIPLQTYTPTRLSGDKIARLTSISDVFASKLVWYPKMRWAEELVEQLASFPASAHDDMVDATSMAIKRFRDGSLIKLPSDYNDDDEERMISLRRREPFY